MSATIIVPARLGSTRFHQKLLHEVRGKPLILWTAERIRDEAPEYPLYFAVDSERMQSVLEAAGFAVVMTDPELTSGTDRIAAANRTVGATRVINVQADEPMVTGSQIRMLDALLGDGIDMATLGCPLNHDKDYRNPNNVKLVRAANGKALYFSRAPIPYIRDTQGVYDEAVTGHDGVLTHLGLYAYTRAFLEAFASLKPGFLEQIEKLEMLRALENGYSIAVGITHDALIEIDTEENAIEFEQAVMERFRPKD